MKFSAQDLAVEFLNGATIANDGRGYAIAPNGIRLRAW